MKKFISLSFCFVLLVGCSTTKRSKDSIQLDDLESTDFKTVKQIRYNQKDDQFRGIKDESRSALTTESLARMEDPSDLEIKGVIDKITIACYEKEFEDAFKLIRSESSSYKRNPIFWNQVGTCYMLKGERRKALLFYNKALEFKASYSPAYNNLGFMYKLEGEDQKALVAFTRSKKANRYARTPLFNLGNLYLEYGLYNQAINTLLGLYNLNQKDIDIINGLAVANLMKGSLSEASKYYSKLDQDLFERPEFGINYAYLLLKQNKKEKARDTLEDIDSKRLGKWENYYAKLVKLTGVQ